MPSLPGKGPGSTQSTVPGCSSSQAPHAAPALWNFPSSPFRIPAAPFQASRHPLLPTSQDPDRPLFLWRTQHPAPNPWGPRMPISTLRPPKGLTLTVTAGSGRSSQAGPGNLHTGHCLWSRSSSEDTFLLGVSRPPSPQPQPAATAAECLPLPCPLTPAEAPAPLCPSAPPKLWTLHLPCQATLHLASWHTLPWLLAPLSVSLSICLSSYISLVSNFPFISLSLSFSFCISDSVS